MSSWPTVAVRDVAHLLSGGTPPKADPSLWHGEVPWVSPKDIKLRFLDDVSDHISDTAARDFSTVVPAGSVLVVVRGMILARDFPVALIRRPMAVNQDMKAIVPNGSVDPEFLLFALLAQKENIQSEIGSSAHGTRRISTEAVERIRIPLPPKREQCAIARVLSKINEARDVQTRTAATLNELKSVLMTKLLREGVYGEPSQNTESGEMPASWGTTTLADVLEFMNYGTSTQCTTESQGLPVLRIPNVISGRIDASNLKYGAFSDSEVARYSLAAGDILFVRTNGNRQYIGRCAVYEGQPAGALFASYLIRARLGEAEYDPHFVQAFLSSTGREQLTSNVNPAADGKFNIDTGALKRVVLPHPSLDEQRAIVRIGKAVDAQIAASEAQRAVLAELFEATLTALMSNSALARRLA